MEWCYRGADLIEKVWNSLGRHRSLSRAVDSLKQTVVEYATNSARQAAMYAPCHYGIYAPRCPRKVVDVSLSQVIGPLTVPLQGFGNSGSQAFRGRFLSLTPQQKEGRQKQENLSTHEKEGREGPGSSCSSSGLIIGSRAYLTPS
jgi:hypothetical protein